MHIPILQICIVMIQQIGNIGQKIELKKMMFSDLINKSKTSHKPKQAQPPNKHHHQSTDSTVLAKDFIACLHTVSTKTQYPVQSKQHNIPQSKAVKPVPVYRYQPPNPPLGEAQHCLVNESATIGYRGRNKNFTLIPTKQPTFQIQAVSGQNMSSTNHSKPQIRQQAHKKAQTSKNQNIPAQIIVPHGSRSRKPSCNNVLRNNNNLSNQTNTKTNITFEKEYFTATNFNQPVEPTIQINNRSVMSQLEEDKIPSKTPLIIMCDKKNTTTASTATIKPQKVYENPLRQQPNIIITMNSESSKQSRTPSPITRSNNTTVLITYQSNDISFPQTPCSVSKAGDSEINPLKCQESIVKESQADCDLDLEYLLNQQRQCFVNPHYMENHKGITARVRGILLEWMMELCNQYKFSSETYHSSKNIVDLYLSRTYNVKKGRIQLLGASALFMSCKIEERIPRSSVEFAQATGNGYTPEQIQDMEIDIVKIMRWKLKTSVAPMWIDLFITKWTEYRKGLCSVDLDFNEEIEQFKEKLRSICISVVDTLGLDEESLRYSTRLLSCSAFLIALSFLHGQLTEIDIQYSLPFSSKYFLTSTSLLVSTFRLFAAKFAAVDDLLDLLLPVQFVSSYFFARSLQHFSTRQSYHTDLLLCVERRTKFITDTLQSYV